MPINQITAPQLQQRLKAEPAPVLLDVREKHEYAYAHIPASQLIPLGQISERYDELDKNAEIVVICHHGVRSLQACHFLQQLGFSQLSNLQGGIDAWSVLCDSSVPRY
ncbi:rhodanese [Methylomonas paludis]|uniref:Rhodanese n=1 Tax=Methylomonas paludis TaxID=1173101 RepID=A0A975MM76_9GAMM|nr:rhodanese-like domain-containing protein [Methylomonas paludis]QWF69939.1 rhodanese [Methylomonas paludis]